MPELHLHVLHFSVLNVINKVLNELLKWISSLLSRRNTHQESEEGRKRKGCHEDSYEAKLKHCTDCFYNFLWFTVVCVLSSKSGDRSSDQSLCRTRRFNCVTDAVNFYHYFMRHITFIWGCLRRPTSSFYYLNFHERAKIGKI